MKPFELIAGLMHKEGVGSLQLAKRMGKPKLQPAIHRFKSGQTREPTRGTAVPIATYFQLPLEALYDDRVATQIAQDRDISAVAAAIVAGSVKQGKAAAEAEAREFATRYVKLSPAARERMRAAFDATSAAPDRPDPKGKRVLSPRALDVARMLDDLADPKQYKVAYAEIVQAIRKAETAPKAQAPAPAHAPRHKRDLSTR